MVVDLKKWTIGVVIVVVLVVVGYFSYDQFSRHNQKHLEADQLKDVSDKNMQAIQKWSLTTIKRIKTLEDEVAHLKERDAQRGSK